MFIFVYNFRQPVGLEPSLGPTNSEFLTETWFMALLGSMVAVMVLLFAAMLLVRRRQLLSKKSTLPGNLLNLLCLLPLSFTFVFLLADTVQTF